MFHGDTKSSRQIIETSASSLNVEKAPMSPARSPATESNPIAHLAFKGDRSISWVYFILTIPTPLVFSESYNK